MLLTHKMKRQTFFAKVEFRFNVRDLEREAQRLHASTHNRFNSSVANDFG